MQSALLSATRLHNPVRRVVKRRKVLKRSLRTKEQRLRIEVEIAVERSNIPILDFFERAAKAYAPQINPRAIKRKVERFLSGCSPPWFVEQHAKKFLRELAMRPT